MDYGMRIASLHKFWGGTWSPMCYQDFNSPKYFLFSYISAIPVCWIGIPFEVARKAYYADQSWPHDLRKGYRSPLHALFKIPFSEGPLYLFKGGLPVYLGNLQFTAVTFFAYTWLKNKCFIFWVYNDINYSWVKFWCLNIAWVFGSVLGYPFYHLKEMMEVWPKERGGRCTFQGSYWNAAKFLRQNYDVYNTNFYEFYWRWFRTQGLIFYIAIWQADNMGLFTNNMSDFNTIYTTVSHSESD
jgi:solute carrier family 25 oxoglutarate transporter 11